MATAEVSITPFRVQVSEPIPEFQPQPEVTVRRRERRLRRLCRRAGLRLSKSRRRHDCGTYRLYPANTTAIVSGSLTELTALMELLAEVK